MQAPMHIKFILKLYLEDLNDAKRINLSILTFYHIVKLQFVILIF
jgi:hypothetical protein